VARGGAETRQRRASFPALCAFAGRTYPLRIGRDGEITELQGAEEALAAAKQTATGLGKQILGGQVDAGSLRSLAQSLIGRLPPQPVAQGEKWRREKKDGFRGTPMLTRTDYTLGRCDGDRIELLVAGSITTPEAKAGQLRLREGKVTGGDLLERSGLVLSATRKTATVSEGPSPVGEGSITVRSTSEHTLVRISEAEAKPAAEDGAKGDKDKG
jgi:hypothetical protein